MPPHFSILDIWQSLGQPMPSVVTNGYGSGSGYGSGDGSGYGSGDGYGDGEG